MTELGTEERPLRVAVIGSGPAGFYAAGALLRGPAKAVVDVFDRLPTPYGLVRSAVAPDHPKTKTVLRVFEKTAALEGFGFWGNVTVGRDVSLDELRRHYDAVILATGMELGARLGIPGEELPGSHTADEFVLWFNGHPDYAGMTVDLSHETAVVIGQGNVAIDAARILVRTVDELRNTDIAQHALDALAESRVREVHLIGRRGPVQAKFSQEEIDELGELADCDPVVRAEDLALDPASQAELDDAKNFNSKRNMKALRALSERGLSGKGRKLCVDFLQSPVEIKGDNRVEALVLEKNTLSGEPFNLKARGTGERIEIGCGLVLRAVGHYGLRVEGAPFDQKRTIFPNDKGRAVQDGEPVPGLYTTGWMKRGPNGLIGTNKADSAETVEALLSDVPSLTPCEQPDGAPLRELLAARGVRVVTQADWERLNAEEERRGEAQGKPREKFVSVEEMISFLG